MWIFVLQVIMLVLKLTGLVSLSWWLVLSLTLVPLLFLVLAVIFETLFT